MNDDGVPSGMAGRWRDFERRLKNLETAQRIRSSGIQGGALTIRQADGDEVATIGELPDGSDGLRVRALGQAFDHFNVNGNGIVRPAMAHQWTRSDLFAVTVTSGTFVATWALYLQYPSGKDLEFVMGMDAPVGTDFELRLRRPALGTTIGTTLAVNGTGVSTPYVYRYPHGITVSTTSGVHLSLECRRTAGAGTVSIYWPQGGYTHGLLSGTPGSAWTAL